MANTPTVTVGVPTFNGSATLEATLDSIQSQTFGDFRVILSDNASTDATREVCERFCRADERFRYQRQETALDGIANFISVRDQAEAPYFFWIGDDDRIGPDFLAETVKFLEAEPGFGAATGVSAYRTGEPADPVIWTAPHSLLAPDGAARMSHYLEFLTDNSEFYSLFRREVIQGVAPVKEHGWDWILMADVVWRAPLAVLPQITIHRHDKWRRKERHREAVAASGSSAIQAQHPHLTTAVRHFLHVSATGRQYERLGARARLELAAQIYRIYVRTKENVPERLDLVDAVHQLMPDLVKEGALIRLAAAVRAAAAESGGGAVAAEVLDQFDLWRLGAGAAEASPGGEPEDAGIGAVVCAALEGHVSKRFRRLPLDAYGGRDLAVALRSAAVTQDLFATTEEHSAFVEFQLQTLADVARMGAADVTHRLPRQSAAYVGAIHRYLQALNFIPMFLAEGNLRPFLEARGNLAEILLRTTGHPVDFDFGRRPRHERLRVGVLATALGSYTDTFTTMPAVAHLDRSRYQVIVLTLNPLQGQASPAEHYFRSLADRLVHLTGGLPDKVRAVREAELDFLLIGNNISAVTNELFLMCAHKLAPCQVALNPCCVTTGLASVDYYLSGTLCEPGEGAQDHYREKLWLAGGPAHVRAIVPGELRRTEVERAPAGPVTLVSAANFYKLAPELRRTWMEILAKTRNTHLLLMPFGPAWSNQYDGVKLGGLLRGDAEEFGVDPSRVSLSKTFESVAELRRAMAAGDLYLDSFPFAGFNSLLDALECGLPAVARAGSAFRSMMGESVLRCLDLPEMVADSRERYVQLAIDLVEDEQRRRDLSRVIADRMAAGPRFYDARWYSGQFAALFEAQPRQPEGPGRFDPRKAFTAGS
jgi:predicted O-linked N-acetylglucosamine transferase (SPINDLY family)